MKLFKALKKELSAVKNISLLNKREKYSPAEKTNLESTGAVVLKQGLKKIALREKEAIKNLPNMQILNDRSNNLPSENKRLQKTGAHVLKKKVPREIKAVKNIKLFNSKPEDNSHTENENLKRTGATVLKEKTISLFRK